MAERFCFDSLPKAQEVSHGDADVARAVKAILDSPEHSRKKGMSPEDRARIGASYREPYEAKAN